MNDPLSIERRAAAEKANRTLRDLCRDLAAGELRLDDFDPGIVAELREVLAGAEPRPDAFAYAGVGSRRTPPEVLAAMADIAQTLGDAGTALSTGGADGADKAFETGALRTDAPITVHTPWPGYNGYRPGRDPETDIDIVHPTSTESVQGRTYLDLAREHHPYWNRCGRGARALFVRNVSILAGARDDDGGTLPVRAVIAYTPNGLPVGRDAGGTGHTLRTAASLDIPCVNLSRRTPPERNAAALAAVPAIVRHAILGRVPGLPR
ncbi:MAG: hypothetical protein OXI79_03435 [Gammaproteobacteria bacterium]|nr:hypothetical protein [Gammaproteobacteria bacterium]